MHAATDTRGEGGIRNCELQRNKRNLDRPFKLLSETSDFGNFTIENLYRVSRKKKKKLDRLDYSVIIERVLSYDKTSIR